MPFCIGKYAIKYKGAKIYVLTLRLQYHIFVLFLLLFCVDTCNRIENFAWKLGCNACACDVSVYSFLGLMLIISGIAIQFAGNRK
jgi:hypothetical protein